MSADDYQDAYEARDPKNPAYAEQVFDYEREG